jgi:hypothetical protein
VRGDTVKRVAVRAWPITPTWLVEAPINSREDPLKRGCIIALAPMRHVVAAVAVVPSAFTSVTVAGRVLMMSTRILRRSSRAKPATLERTDLHGTRDRQRHDGRSRVDLVRVDERVPVPQKRHDLGACGGRRHR